ncbi:hypothetical protein L6452_09057 [Arctium lappa]|uniref:Uncharacterized protein n=1 Tax=Arctium lappa TaxID=4217 RepID=A0ACB9DIX7_ARCLA|nr:hypothetical protein L6452_09057 [Arctium lappa]
MGFVLDNVYTKWLALCGIYIHLTLLINNAHTSPDCGSSPITSLWPGPAKPKKQTWIRPKRTTVDYIWLVLALFGIPVCGLVWFSVQENFKLETSLF